MRVSLRPFLETDLPTLDTWAASGELASYMGRWMPRCGIGPPDKVLWRVIVADGHDVGSIWLEKEDAPENVVTLGILIGDPSMRGKGIGRQAIRLALDEARDVWSPHQVRLRVRAANERAIRCYTALGFRQSEAFQRTLPGGESVDVLMMTLSPGE
ncbi:MAG: N-acetyltransferase [Verrucomicrobiaceae bacterium]|nr:MAG: N-acetyltransferase [Verrucomicrobiaceae bacterium]